MEPQDKASAELELIRERAQRIASWAYAAEQRPGLLPPGDGLDAVRHGSGALLIALDHLIPDPACEPLQGPWYPVAGDCGHGLGWVNSPVIPLIWCVDCGGYAAAHRSGPNRDALPWQ